MAFLPLRALPARANAAHVDAWLEALGTRLADPATQTPEARAVICRETLAELLYPTYAADWETAVNDERLPLGTRVALELLDPRNVTLEPEYYAECDDEKFQRVKPLLWLWYAFDRSPLGGQHVEFTFGYNMEVGDDVVVHRHVLLDDRGGIVLGNKVSISDYANVYSHTHSIIEQRDVTNVTTVLGDGVRVTYHATVLAGVHVNEQGMVGAVAVATKDVRPYHVYVGIPAKSVRVKPNAPEPATILRTSDQRGPR